MASRLPIRVSLYGGAYQFVPARTVILNPELEGEATQLYLIWASVGEGSNKGILSEVSGDENTPIFAWLSDDERFVTSTYQMSPEFYDCIHALGQKTNANNDGEIEIAIAKPQAAMETPGMVARFRIEQNHN